LPGERSIIGSALARDGPGGAVGGGRRGTTTVEDEVSVVDAPFEPVSPALIPTNPTLVSVMIRGLG
jgi:hypothetical protein